MLETLLPGVGHFRRPHRIRHVAHEGYLLLPGFFGDGEDGIARDQRLQLDEIRSAALEIVDGAAAVLGRSDSDGTGKARPGTIEHRTGSENARTDLAPRFDFVAPILKDIEFAAHVAYAGDAIDDEERQVDVAAAGKPVA